MNQEDIKNILSDININSETAVEAAEIYIKFMYFERVMDFLSGICFVSVLVAFTWFCVNLLKESQ